MSPEQILLVGEYDQDRYIYWEKKKFFLQLHVVNL
jgi:hypothetical protein